MKLFGHPDSGHSLKVKFFLDWLGIEYLYEYVDIFSNRETRGSEFLTVSKFSEVPTLIDNEKYYIQSNAIIIYLADKYGVFNSNEERQKNIEWLVWEANKIGMCLPQLRADKKFSEEHPEFKLSKGAYDWLLARYSHDVNLLDNELNDNRQFILGDKISPADFSLSAYLMYANEAEVEVPKNVENWLNRLKEQKGWKSPYEMLNLESSSCCIPNT